MFIPVVPYIPHTTVINKTIMYSDTVLNLNSVGNNIKVTSVSDVKEYDLENCLKIIFKSNPDVVFNTIQYSKKDKKVYFYTDKEITTKDYEDSKYITYKPISSRTEILEEIKRVLMAPKNKDNDCISLYDVSLLLKRLDREYGNVLYKYRSQCNYILDSKLPDSSFLFYKFDYSKMTLNTGFKRYRSGSWGDINFAKNNGDLYVTEAESCYRDEVFSILSSCLSEAYDELVKYSDYISSDYAMINKKSVNSKFIVCITHYGVDILVKNGFETEFSLYDSCHKDEYVLKCNSNIVNEAVKGNEEEIFKRVFVRISDCPKWCQNKLYEIRQNQLAREQRIEDEIKYKEMRKARRLQLVRKIFPFIKNKTTF